MNADKKILEIEENCKFVYQSMGDLEYVHPEISGPSSYNLPLLFLPPSDSGMLLVFLQALYELSNTKTMPDLRNCVQNAE